jgi:drug/metabolite transporter (DMT)-like permease
MFYIFLALLSALLFGAATPLGKVLLQAFSPFQLAGVLYIGAALGVSPFVFRQIPNPKVWHSDRKNMLRLSLAILCGGIIAPLFLLKGLITAASASVSLWLPLEMVATAILGVLLFHDHLGPKGWAGMIGVIAASILLGIAEPSAGVKSGCFILAACLCWGIDNNLTALIDNISPAQSTFWKGLIAGLVNLTIGLMLQPYQATILITLCALITGALCYGASIMFYIASAQNIGASRAQMFFASNPFFGLAMAAFFLDEPISMMQWLAAFIVLLSLIIVLFSRHFHPHIHPSFEHEHGHPHDDEHHNHRHDSDIKGLIHSHKHTHSRLEHSHPHWPDLHHRHRH